MTQLEWRNAARTILARIDGTHTEIIEVGHPEWVNLSTNPEVAPFVPPPAPVPAIPSLTFAQLLIGLVSEGWITEAEGDDWATGKGLPAAVQSAVATLPEAERFPARARLYRMSVAMRSDPMVAALATADGRTAAEVDAFFVTHSA